MEKEGDTDFAINVAVVDDAIIVTMPGTRYSVTYRKGADPWLLASDNYYDPAFPSHKFTFQARACTAANEHARRNGRGAPHRRLDDFG
jgi:hypothetical protein